jgi:peptidoglycan-associated lipoprotein
MRKQLWVSVALLLVIPGLLFTVSCAKKTIQAEPAMQTEESKQKDMEAQAEEAKRQEEQKRIEEERLAAEKAQKETMAAKSMFENEDIHFDFDSSVIGETAQAILQAKAEYIRNYPKSAVIIEGYCDDRGTEAYNLALGERRAEAAKNYLVNLGIDASRLTTISYGEERPIDPGQNEAAWAKNRRAHFVIE